MANHWNDRVDYLAFRLLFAYATRLILSNTREPPKELLDIFIGCHNFDQQNNVLTAFEKMSLLIYVMSIGELHGIWTKAVEYGNKLLALPGLPFGIKISTLVNVGMGYHYTGDSVKAQQNLKMSLKLSKKLRGVDKMIMAGVYYSHGIFYRDTGEYKKGLDFFQRQLQISKGMHDKNKENQEMVAYSGLGSIYCNIGQYEKARKNIERSLRISEKLNHTAKTAINYHDLANVYAELDKNEQALEYYKKCLKIATDVDSVVAKDLAYSSLGRLYRKMGNLEEAAKYHESSLNISKDLSDLRGEGVTLLNLGNVYVGRGEFKKSIEYLEKALKISKECNDVEGEMLANHNLGSKHQLIGQHDTQCRYLCQSISISDKIREDFKKQDQSNLKISKLGHSFLSHILLMKGLLSLGHIKKALLVLDVGRSKSLFDLLRLSSTKISESPSQGQFSKWIEQIPSIIGKPEKDSHSDISDNVCRSLKDTTVLVYGFDNLSNTLFIWVLTQQGTFYKHFSNSKGKISLKKCLEEKISKMRPKSENNRSALKLEDKRDALREGNAEMLYKLPEQFKNKPIPEAGQTSTQFASKVPQGNSGKTNAEGPSRNPTGAANQPSTPRQALHSGVLYQALIGHVEDQIRGSKLIIVPAHSMFLLPFSALVDHEGKYLCDRYSIQITPALHTLNFSLSVPMKKLGPALAVGNPCVGKVRFQGQVVDVSSLPGAADEAAECAKFFHAQPFVEKEATKKKVIERLRSAGVVHIAAHGTMNYGEIFLAPDPTAPKPPQEKHYLLMPEDITKCSLSARLVVLSCCHSGRGEVSSEGVAGTARAFLGAGARAVLVALWQLPDGKTRVFMKRFYENISTGLSVCVALQQAMITFKEQDDDVEAWAPFQIFGEDVTMTNEDIAEICRLSRECTVSV